MTDLQGRRFSLNYLSRPERQADSRTARFRIGKLCEASCPPSTYTSYGHTPEIKKRVVEAIERNIGILFASKSQAGTLVENWVWYFNRIDLVYMLDSITVIANSLGEIGKSQKRNFVTEMKRILQEEHLAYRIDEDGSVHPFVDAAFANIQESTVLALSNPRYNATRSAVTEIDGHLLASPPRYKEAIRCVFHANENLFKLMFSAQRLNADAAEKHLGALAVSLYEEDKISAESTSRILNGLKSWINAAHYYRHEQGTVEPTEPTTELAILMISQGISYTRWLAQLDTLAQQRESSAVM